MVELHAEVGRFLQDVTSEEIHAVIVRGKDLPFLGFGNGSQLVYVADHQHLNAAEGLLRPSGAAQHGVDGVEHIGTDHADLVDDQKAEAPHEVEFVLSELLVLRGHGPGIDRRAFVIRRGRFSWQDLSIFRDLWPEGQLEKRVDGLSSSVDGGHACRGDHHHAFIGLVAEAA